MADTQRPSTPPRPPAAGPAQSPITPEQVRRMEESRLRAKALRQQQDAAQAQAPAPRQSSRSISTAPNASLKRSHSSMSQQAPQSVRNAAAAQAKEDSMPRPARKFQKYVEYDFSKMTDTKGGFMTAEDDPHNKALHTPDAEKKPANMSLKEWEALQLQRKLRKSKTGPYEPGLSVLDAETKKKCRECGTLEIDFHWDEHLHTQVCHACKEKLPEKYSLLTKTEAKEDYLLTDPELRDTALLPHLEKPNPHHSTWNNMMLYLRYQVEDYAFSEQKWGSAEALDEEFERRKQQSKDRKDKSFRNRLKELKKRTRVEAYKRARAGGGGDFGDTIGRGRHEHEWGEAVEDVETGMSRRRCVECGMEVEELEF